jgi:type I restriction enzyme S subunit
MENNTLNWIANFIWGIADDVLREYRTRLITDVVTGKLDVREAAALLHDEAEEPELVDGGNAMNTVDDEPVEDLDTVPEEVGA